jgi:hypothetical protein
MSTLYPIFKKTYSSMAAGGGVPGKAAGTVHITTTEDGLITDTRLLFIKIFLQAGEMITGIGGGRDMNGNISGYLTVTFNAIGAAGKETDIGKNKIHGE